MKMINVLLVQIPPFDPFAGGVQKATNLLGKYFTEKGMEVAYFSFSDSDNKTPECGRLYNAAFEGNSSNKYNMVSLTDCVKDFNPDVVINQMPPDQNLRVALKQLKSNNKFKLIGCLHNSLFKVKNDTRQTAKDSLPSIVFKIFDSPFGLNLLFGLWKIKFAKRLKDILDIHDVYITETPINITELEYYIGKYKNDKVSSIPNAIPEVLKELPRTEKIILHVGRIEVTQKRSDLLLPFWKKVYKDLPEWKFVIVGEGSYLEELSKQIKVNDIPRIELKGYQDPLPYLKASPIFMIPSAFEGLPNTVLEAHSNGLVVLAFDSYPALRWIVRDEIDAKLIAPYNIEEMAREFVDLTFSPKKLNQMRASALENAERFTIEAVGKEWISLFEKVINK